MRHCSGSKIDPVNAASFGKLIRSVFIGLKTRRLGTRYAFVCYCLSVYLYCKGALYVMPPLSVGSVAEEIQNITTMGSESSLILHWTTSRRIRLLRQGANSLHKRGTYARILINIACTYMRTYVHSFIRIELCRWENVFTVCTNAPFHCSLSISLHPQGAWSVGQRWLWWPGHTHRPAAPAVCQWPQSSSTKLPRVPLPTDSLPGARLALMTWLHNHP